MTIRIIIAIAFVLGFVLGFGLSTLFTLLCWFFVGLAIVAVLDVAAGLNQRACALRVRVRQWLAARMGTTPVRKTNRIWINI